MQRLQPVPLAHHSYCKPHQNKDLSTCTHVIVRRDAVRRALQPSYDGPFEVLKHAAKFFIALVNSQRQTISIDRVKTAHLEVPLVRSRTELPTLHLLKLTPLREPPAQVGMSTCLKDLFLDIIRPAHWGGVLWRTHCLFSLCIRVLTFCVSMRCFCNLHGTTDAQF